MSSVPNNSEGSSRPRKKSAQKKRFLLRIDPQLYATLERWAADDFRSVNAQIEWLLADATRRAGRTKGEPPAED